MPSQAWGSGKWTRGGGPRVGERDFPPLGGSNEQQWSRTKRSRGRVSPDGGRPDKRPKSRGKSKPMDEKGRWVHDMAPRGNGEVREGHPSACSFPKWRGKKDLYTAGVPQDLLRQRSLHSRSSEPAMPSVGDDWGSSDTTLGWGAPEGDAPISQLSSDFQGLSISERQTSWADEVAAASEAGDMANLEAIPDPAAFPDTVPHGRPEANPPTAISRGATSGPPEEQSRSTSSTGRSASGRTKGKTKAVDRSFINGVALIATNDWGPSPSEQGTTNEEDHTFVNGVRLIATNDWGPSNPTPWVDEDGQNRSDSDEALPPVGADWGAIPGDDAWTAALREANNNVVQEWEVNPVWEDGPARDLEPEEESDSATAAETRSSATLANPSELPDGVPDIVYNDIAKLERIRDTEDRYVGIAAAFNDKCRVSAVVLATSEIIVLVDTQKQPEGEEQNELDNDQEQNVQDNEQNQNEHNNDQQVRLRELLIDILGRAKPANIGVEFGRLALCIQRDLGIHVHGMDLSSSLSGSTHMFYAPAQLALMAGDHPHKNTLKELGEVLSDRPPDEMKPNPLTLSVAAALFASMFASEKQFDIEKVIRLDTSRVLEAELQLLGNMQLQTDVVENVRPTSYEADFVSWQITEKRSIVVTNARYATKIRAHMNVIVTLADGNAVPGKAVAVHGTRTMIEVQDRSVLSGNPTVRSILVVGGDTISTAEIAKRNWMLSQLREPTCMADRSEIFRAIWFPIDADIEMLKDSVAGAPKLADNDDEWRVQLDESQAQVAAVMCYPEYPLVLTHGPPGSGKTRTISAAVHRWTEEKQTAWLVCQSNVGVKNIAESLVHNDFSDFKLLVSKEFYTAWHESIYIDVAKNLITLEDLPENISDVRYMLRNYPVILCTLSMMSNPSLVTRGIFDVVPVRNLVIDEASQIFCGDFAHLFYRIAPDLKKVCWFGDPCQLPPYGSDLSEGLATVFDLHHLRDNMHFLRTTYRVPFALNQFLSDEVYSGNLHSRFKPDRSTYVLKFVHVQGEEMLVGTSWRNMQEAMMIVELVEKYYHSTNFVILTPYDAQRACIDQLLRQRNPAWNGKVFNVDSFQGNEADFVLLSLTRTTRPGFLTSDRRSNVMLSRCRFGMVIVTKRSFLHRRDVKKTLVGKLADRWERNHPTTPWVEEHSILNRSVDMPGVKGDKPNRPTRGWQGHDPDPYARPKQSGGIAHTTYGSLYKDIFAFDVS